MKEAVTLFREALKERTRDKELLLWAGTQNNLAMALSSLGMMERRNSKLEEALDLIREVLKEISREEAPIF